MKIKLTTLVDTDNFAEIFQQNKTKFAFVKETAPREYKQQHGLVQCRDFLNDVLTAEADKETFSIYSFSWNPKKNLIDRDATKLYIKLPTSLEKDNLIANLSALHEIEKTNKLKRTRVYSISDHEVVVIGSSFWLKKCWAISLYTFILKCLTMSNDFSNLTSNEQEYLSRCGGNFHKLLKNIRTVLKAKGSVHGVKGAKENTVYKHNYSGFVAVCSNGGMNIYNVTLEELK